MKLPSDVREWLLRVNPLRDPLGIQKRQQEELVKKLERMPEPQGEK